MDQYLDLDGYNALSPEDKERAVAITDPREAYDPRELAAYASEWLTAFGLNEHQAVFSSLGLNGILVPRLADANGRGRLVDTGDLESTAKLAIYAVNYLPDRQKLRPPGLSDTQWNMMLHLLNQAAGGDNPENGRLADVPYSFGIDLDTAAGLGELEEALASRPSQFDQIQLDVGEDQYRGILAYVRTMDDGGDNMSVAVVSDAWSDEGDTLLVDIMEHRVACSASWEQMQGLAIRARDGGDPAALQTAVSAVSQGFELVVASGLRSADGVSGLRYLASAASEVGSGRPYTPLSQFDQASNANSERWDMISLQVDIEIGVLLQFYINGTGTAEGAGVALGNLLDLIDQLLHTAEDNAIEAVGLHAALLKTLEPLRNPEPDGKAPPGPVRPGWLQ